MKYAERFDPDGVPWPDALTRLARKYRVTEGQLRSWYLGGCGIDGCLRTSLVIDHDHDCCLRAPTCGNCTRGVLCSHHNSSLEAFIDSPSVVRYLHRTQAGRSTIQRHVTVNDELFIPPSKIDIRSECDKQIALRAYRNKIKRYKPSKRRIA